MNTKVIQSEIFVRVCVLVRVRLRVRERVSSQDCSVWKRLGQMVSIFFCPFCFSVLIFLCLLCQRAET